MTRHSHHGMFSSRCFELPAQVAEVPPLIAQTHAIKIVRRRRQPWHFGTARELVDSAARLHTGGFWGEKHDRVHSMDPSHCATVVPPPLVCPCVFPCKPRFHASILLLPIMYSLHACSVRLFRFTYVRNRKNQTALCVRGPLHTPFCLSFVRPRLRFFFPFFGTPH